MTELKRTAATEGIPLAIIEKDYALSIVLMLLSRTKLKDKLVFKGGTAIKKVYFRKARFSEDLDFTVEDAEPKEILEELNKILDNKEIAGIRFGKFEHEKTTAGLQLALKFTGLLEYPQRIRFDFSFRENAIMPPIERAVFDDYLLGETKIRALPIDELFAEKIHAAFSRTAARDLYDIWFLLKNDVKPCEELIQKKFAYYSEEYDLDKLKDRLEDFKPKWSQDLSPFQRDVPAFDTVAKSLLTMLQNK